MNGTIADQAEALAARGSHIAAIRLLEDAADRGDVHALHTLALWHLIGAHVPRDLVAARHWLRRATALGHFDAALIEIALAANGTGAPADWAGALAFLRQAARSDPLAADHLALIDAMAIDASGAPAEPIAAEQLASRPDVRRFQAFLSPAECAHIALASNDILEPAVVVDPKTGRHVAHPVRSSHAAVIGPTRETLVIQAINRRIAAASGTDVTQGEPLTVLRYTPGQQYRPHHDALPDSRNQRGWTMLLYLNDAYRGGETQFGAIGLTVQPKAGDALLFRNLDSAGRPDPLARHAGLPVVAGSKWLATRWIRLAPHDPWSAAPDR